MKLRDHGVLKASNHRQKSLKNKLNHAETGHLRVSSQDPKSGRKWIYDEGTTRGLDMILPAIPQLAHPHPVLVFKHPLGAVQ